MISIWAVLEYNGALFHEQSGELLGELMEIVQHQPAPAELCAVVLAAPTSDDTHKSELLDGGILAGFGVGCVYWLEHQALEHYGTEQHVAALAWLVQRFRPTLVATSATLRGRDWAPRIAARLHLP